MDITHALQYGAALFAIVSPLSSAPVFLAMTAGNTQKERNRIAFTAAFGCAIILLVVALFGDYFLQFFGISINGFRIAGGIAIFTAALEMLKSKPEDFNQTESSKDQVIIKQNPGVFPIAVPLLAGPGAFTTTILYLSEVESKLGFMPLMIGVIFFISFLCYLTFRLACMLSSKIGPNGLNIITRIMGLIVATIAVEIMVGGILAFFPGLGA